MGLSSAVLQTATLKLIPFKPILLNLVVNQMPHTSTLNLQHYLNAANDSLTQFMSKGTSVMAQPVLQNPAPSVKELSKPGELNTSLTQLSKGAVFPFMQSKGLSPCYCHPGDYCMNECIGIDDLSDDQDTFKLNVSSGEDAFV